MSLLKALVYDRLHPSIEGMLTEMGIEVVFLPDLPASEVVNHVADYDIIIGRTKVPINHDFIKQAQKLKVIIRAGAGLDDIDLVTAKERSITVINAPEGNAASVGEHAVGLLLSLLHKISSSHQEVVAGKWVREGNRSLELGARTVGIIGYGNNGSAFAKCLSGFGCKILAYDKYKSGFGTALVKECSLAQIQAEADVISFHVPLTSETHYLFNNEFIRAMEHPFYLLNVCRGEVVDTQALWEGLTSEKILGAGLDVLEQEAPEKRNEAFRQLFSKFSGLANVVLTPHVAGLSKESYIRINTVILEKLHSILPSILEKTKINH